MGQLDSKTGFRVGSWKSFNKFGRLDAAGNYRAGKKSGWWTEVDWDRGEVFVVQYANGVAKTRAHKKFLSDKKPSDLDNLIENYRSAFAQFFRIAPTNIGN